MVHFCRTTFCKSNPTFCILQNQLKLIWIGQKFPPIQSLLGLVILRSLNICRRAGCIFRFVVFKASNRSPRRISFYLASIYQWTSTSFPVPDKKKKHSHNMMRPPPYFIALKICLAWLEEYSATFCCSQTCSNLGV